MGRARDLAPPAPSVAQQLGGFFGDLAGGAWSELSATGQFLWQVNPTRFLVEPAAAVQGWQDLGTGVAHAVTHPAETVAAALNPREAATNPTRWAGEMLTGAGLSALGGAGAAGRIERATRAAGALPAGAPDDGGDQLPPLGRYNGLTAAEHAANEGVLIGRPGSAKKMKVPTRELDTSQEVDEVYRALSEGGQVVKLDDSRTVVLLEDGTYMTWRPTSGTPPGESARRHQQPEAPSSSRSTHRGRWMTADAELKADLRRGSTDDRIDLFHAMAMVKIVEGGEGRPPLLRRAGPLVVRLVREGRLICGDGSGEGPGAFEAVAI